MAGFNSNNPIHVIAELSELLADKGWLVKKLQEECNKLHIQNNHFRGILGMPQEKAPHRNLL